LTFIHNTYAASILGARADRKKANFPVAHGLTPNMGSMTEGITAAINSCCRLPFEKISGGASTMWDFDSSWATEEVISAIIKTFIQNNGQIFQGNTSSLQDLISAQKNPDEYSHLIVRVGGYSARFVNLSTELQNEIINRKRHCC
jgi:formate C-acetyltransferase